MEVTMSEYKLVFWESVRKERPVREWLVALPLSQKKKVDMLLKLIEQFGPALRMPNGKPLGEGLYEARDDSKGPGFRIYYQKFGNAILVLLVGGNKSSQKRDIETARSRMKKANEGK
jgi:putative addiction module killer protein